MKRFLFPILGIWLLLYGSFALVRPPLLDNADGLHAEMAHEMLSTHDWVTPHLNGVRYLEKAPLLPWSVAASFRIFGEHDWAARLPLALYALALFLVIFFSGRLLFNSPQAGFYAALALLTSCGIFGFTRILLPDAILCLWLTLAIHFFWKSLEETTPSLASAIGFAIACALGVLAKGLIGVVFPIAIVLIYLAWMRNLRHILRWHPLAATAAFLVVAAPWHILAALRNPTLGTAAGAQPTQGNVHGFLWYYFVHEHFLRYLGQRDPQAYNTVPLLLFWVLLFVFIAPWCVFAVTAMARLPWRSITGTENRASLLLVIWAAVVMVFFSFSARQEYYLLPALPPLALLAGNWLALDEDGSSAAGKRIAWVLFVLGFLAAVWALFLAMHFQPLPIGTDVSSFLRDEMRTHRLFLGHFFDLTLQAVGAFRVPFYIASAALAVGVSANLWFRLKSNARMANCFLLGAVIAVLIASHLALNSLSPLLSSQILAEAIKPEVDEGDAVIVNGRYEHASSLAFYIARPVELLDGRNSTLWYGSFFPDAPQVFIDNTALASLWTSPKRVFLWTPLDRIPQLPGEVFVVARSGGKEILSNRPNDRGAEF